MSFSQGFTQSEALTLPNTKAAFREMGSGFSVFS
jgi:hypothetical protein